MDNWFKSKFGNQIVVRHVFFKSFNKETILSSDVVLPLLDDKKKFKYMAKQDCLGLYGASEIIKLAGLSKLDLQEKVGLGLVNSYLPFHRDDLVGLIESSHRENEFNIDEFILNGIRKIHPLTTFKCLPNMPMFHISVNFGIKNSYYIGYPNGLQLYHALVWGCSELQKDEIDFVLIGGVEDNLNFLVEQHYLKNKLPLPKEDRVGFIVLEKIKNLNVSASKNIFIFEDLVCNNEETLDSDRSFVSANINICALFENLLRCRVDCKSLNMKISDGMNHECTMNWRYMQ